MITRNVSIHEDLPMNAPQADGRFLDAVRSDYRKWRRLVSRCAQSERWIPPALDLQYRTVHRRIIAACRAAAETESASDLSQPVARDLAELLGPWSSPKALAEAPKTVVQDLLKKTDKLENCLHHGTSRAARMAIKISLAAGLAGGTGLAASFLFRWISNYGSRGIGHSLTGLTASLATTIQQSSFSERFAVAVVVSWALGTWLLSNVYKS